MDEQPPRQQNGWTLSLLHAVKGLSFVNILMIALLVAIAIPVYWTYRVLNDPQLLDRFLSSFYETSFPNGCTLRQVKERGGPERWGISSGFAFQGNDSWQISVVLNHEPSSVEIESFCASLHLIVGKMLNEPS